MHSLSAYWNLFVQAEWRSWTMFYQQLRHLSWSDPWLAPLWIVLGLFAIEWLRPWRGRQRKLRPGLALDVFYFFFNWMLVWVLFGSAFFEVIRAVVADSVKTYFGAQSPVLIPLNGMQLWARFVLFIAFGDFFNYWLHVLMHRVDFLWEFHKVHHSSQQLDVWNAQRFHFVERVFVAALYVPFAVVVGWPTEDIFGFLFVGGAVTNILSCFTHANVRIPLGPFKYLFNNPQLHLWHHARAVDNQKNVNYGDSFSLWDYLFRTAYLPSEQADLEIGFAGDAGYPTTFWGQTLAPFAALWARSTPGGRA